MEVRIVLNGLNNQELKFLLQLITVDEVCKAFGRCPVSVKRAVARGELPPPVKMFGKDVWLLSFLKEHVLKRLLSVSKKWEEEERRLKKFDL